MSLILSKKLKCIDILRKEGIKLCYAEGCKDNYDVEIGILNLMPTKVNTEIQLLRILSMSPLNIKVEFIYTKTHKCKTTSMDYVKSAYKTFNDVKNKKYDGFIITGAPVEKIPFEEVDYWNELKDIMDFANKNSNSVFYICWGAQAGLYYNYGVNKCSLKEKKFGIFKHEILNKEEKITCGFDDEFLAPHSRNTRIKKSDIEKNPNLKLISTTLDGEVYIVQESHGNNIYVMGHSEYERNTLRDEYFRDKNKGLKISMPINYFKENNPNSPPMFNWKSHGVLLYLNWLHYYVVKK